MTTKILVGDALTVLRTLPEESIQCCVTSPPYWSLRDYGHEGQIGTEATPEEFVAKLVAVFREVRRVLRSDGTCWMNLGDTYAANRTYQVPSTKGGAKHSPAQGFEGSVMKVPDGLKPKDLVGVPWMTAFALRADGWWLRSDIIWSKPNVMPEAVTDRPTKAHEYMFLLTKSERYFYDSDAIRERHDSAYSKDAIEKAGGAIGGVRPAGNNFNKSERHELGEGTPRTRAERAALLNPAGRNARSVWTITTQSYSGAHFATFPEELPRRCILAGTSEHGACSTCGSPYERELERHETKEYEYVAIGIPGEGDNRGRRTESLGTSQYHATGNWKPTCKCVSAGIKPCVVLDPFAGSGTTGAVADANQRDFIGIELNPSYAELAKNRIYKDGAPLFSMMGGMK